MTDDADRIEGLWRSGDASVALEQARQVLAAGGDRLGVAEALQRVADRADGAEAEAAARLAASLREAEWPAGHPRGGYAAMPLAEWFRRHGRLDEADAVLEHSELLAAQGGDTDGLRDVALTRARLWVERGRPAEAEKAFQQAIEVDDRRPPGRPPLSLPLVELRMLYEQQGRYADAAQMLRQELALARRPGVSAEDLATMNAELANLLKRAGER